MNYKLTIAYDGTDFFGWQKQKSGRTIQDDIEKSLNKIFKINSINLIGSGRTDSGVHALNQVANFNIETNMTEEQIKMAINSNVKNDIYIKKCKIVNDKFHSRYSAIKREYIYKINQKYLPFNRKFSWNCNKKLSKDLLIKSSELIIGKHDFSNFCKSTSKKENNLCDVYDSKWEFKDNLFLYKISANRFLHHMVRMLVGTAIEVSSKKISIDEFNNMVNNESSLPVFTAPSFGLFLSKIYYK